MKIIPNAFTRHEEKKIEKRRKRACIHKRIIKGGLGLIGFHRPGETRRMILHKSITTEEVKEVRVKEVKKVKISYSKLGYHRYDFLASLDADDPNMEEDN